MYPDYPLPPITGAADGTLKAGLIGRYVRDYHAALRKLERLCPTRTLLLPTEVLGEAATQRRLYEFLGQGDGMFGDVRLNAGTISDGGEGYKF